MWNPKYRYVWYLDNKIQNIIETNTEPHNLFRQNRIKEMMSITNKVIIITLDKVG